MESSTAEPMAPAADASEAFYKCTLYYFIVGTCLGGSILLIGFIGNGCTLAIMYNERRRSSTINCLFLLAIADTMVLLMLALLIFPMGLRKILFGWWNGHNYNHVAFVYAAELMYISNQISALLTVLVTFQRYISVCRPHRAKQLCTVKRVNQLAALSAAFSFLFYCPRFFMRKVVTGADGRFTHSNSPIIATPLYYIFYSTILTALVSYLLPLALLSFMTVSILLALKKKVGPEKARNQVRKDLTISSIIIVCIFITCQSFVFARNVLEWKFFPLFKHERCQGSMQFYVMTPYIAMMINSSANFLVFVFFAKGFRRRLMRRKAESIEGLSTTAGSSKEHEKTVEDTTPNRLQSQNTSNPI